MALTYPAVKSALTPGPSGISGAFAPENRGSVFFPLANIFLSNFLNLVWLGPWTTRVMRERKHQGKLMGSTLD